MLLLLGHVVLLRELQILGLLHQDLREVAVHHHIKSIGCKLLSLLEDLIVLPELILIIGVLVKQFLKNQRKVIRGENQ